MATYTIVGMRVVFPKGKVAENNLDRFATVYGKFLNEKGTAFSFTSKAITLDEAKADGFVLDIANGILTLPDGQRGRKEYASVSQDEIDALLTALRSEN